MKRIVIALTFIAVVILAIPFIGNQFAQETIEQRIELLSSYGVEVSDAKTDASYLSTQKYYKFRVADEKKFVNYLNQFSTDQLPPYVNAMVKGVEIGVDLKYSNLPLSDNIVIDIYPLTLSIEMMEGLQKEEPKFYEYLKEFLESKGVLYHLNYNIVKSSFDGYIKDINESYTLEDKSQIEFTLRDALYHGTGELIAPTSIASTIDSIKLSLIKSSQKIIFDLDGFSSNSIFESQNTYSSDADLKKLSLVVASPRDIFMFNAASLSMNLASKTQGNYAELFTKSSLEKFNIKSKDFDINATNLSYDVSVSGIDKDKLEELRLLLSNSSGVAKANLNKKIESTTVELLSKGLNLDISDFSIEDINYSTENLKGFSINSTLKLKADPNLAKKIGNSQMQLLQGVDIDLNLKISKPIFRLITELNPMAFMVKSYAKEDGDSLLFNISFINSELKVNGKALR